MLPLIRTMSNTLFVTGFEPFLDVSVNPSGEVARRLDGRVLADGMGVVACQLPVSFEAAPRAFEAALKAASDGLAGPPLAIVSLGVQRGSAFRLERRARAVFGSDQSDNDGQTGSGVRLEGPDERETSLDLDRCEGWLREAGAAEVMISSDAGGYLCERVYRAGLDAGALIDVPVLFLHVPPVEQVGVDDQERIIEGFLLRLASSLMT